MEPLANSQVGALGQLAGMSVREAPRRADPPHRCLTLRSYRHDKRQAEDVAAFPH